MDRSYLYYILKHSPNAIANIKGSINYPGIEGRAAFYQIHEGVIVYTEITGLRYEENNPFTVHGYHIHEGGECAGNSEEPFSEAGEHYNPTNVPHPYHAGDLPPLFSNYGNACVAVFTARFKVKDIIDRVIIVHKEPDDFTTQPTGAAGEKIACGEIKAFHRLV